MKNIPSAAKETDTAKLILDLSCKEKGKSPVESPDLSPERFTERASTANQVLNRFLERDNKTHYLRHWGINE